MPVGQLITTAATAKALTHGLPPALVVAIIGVESDGNTMACRFEPAYRWCWDMGLNRPYTASRLAAGSLRAPPDFSGHGMMSANTEWVQQKTSWGLMQIMGANARAYGFVGDMPQLTNVETGIEFGCRHLKKLKDRWFDDHGWAGVVDAYNDGDAIIERPHDYPDLVAAQSAAAAKLIGRS